MKKLFFALLIATPLISFAQEKTKMAEQTTVKRVSVGMEMFHDFWMNEPDDMDVRGFDQGAGTFAMYSIPFGDSPVSFALGAGISWHNLYSNTRILNIKADTIVFTPIPDTIDYKKSKFSVTYLDFPLEFRLKTNKKVYASVGVKLSYVIDAKTKYKGDKLSGYQGILKEKQVSNIDKFQFGPQVRIGYEWVHIVAYYSVTRIFEKGKGPDVYPISLGITFMPF